MIVFFMHRAVIGIAYHLQVVGIHEYSVAILAVILICSVTLSFHVLRLRAVAIKLVIATIAFKLWTPMASCVHVLVSSMLGSEVAIASFAFKFGKVVCVAHVLMASLPRAESSVTGLAFRPVTCLIHVLVAMGIVVEVLVTS
jgi:hypothetical protein